MPFRLSRQLFYTLAAGCMCTWICITYLVVKTGTKSKRIDEDLYTQHGFDISDDYGVVTEVSQGAGNWLKNWIKNAFKNPDTMEKTENEGDVGDIYREDREGEIEDDEADNVINNIEGDEKEGNKFDSVRGSDKNNKNEDGNVLKRIDAQEGDNVILKWEREKGILDIQKINNAKIKGEFVKNENVYKGNVLQDQDGHMEKSETDNDTIMTEQVEDEDDVTSENAENVREDNDVEDVEEDEVDRAAKYRDLENKNDHAHVLDDGEDDNEEEEDMLGDDNEHDNKFDHDDNEDIFRYVDVRIPKKMAIGEDHLEEITEKYADKGDIIQDIKKFPQVDPQNNEAELKNDENVFDHGDQPFAKLKEHDDNNPHIIRDNATLTLKDKETPKHGNHPIQDIELERLKQNNDTNDQYLVKDSDKTNKGKVIGVRKVTDSKKGQDGNVPANQEKIVRPEKAINLSNKGRLID